MIHLPKVLVTHCKKFNQRKRIPGLYRQIEISNRSESVLSDRAFIVSAVISL